MDLLWLILYIVIGLACVFIVCALGIGLTRAIINYTSKENPYLKRAQEFLEQEKFDEAKEQYEKALEVKTPCAEALYGIGKINELKGNNKKALEYYEKTVSASERFPAAYHDMGWIHQLNGNFKEAISFYEKAISFNRKFLKSHLNIAEIYADEGKIDEALEKYDDVMFLDKNNTAAYLGAIDLLFGVRRFKDALTMCEKFLKVHPGNIDGIFSLAMAYFFLDDPENYQLTRTKLEELNPLVIEKLDNLVLQHIEAIQKIKKENTKTNAPIDSSLSFENKINIPSATPTELTDKE